MCVCVVCVYGCGHCRCDSSPVVRTTGHLECVNLSKFTSSFQELQGTHHWSISSFLVDHSGRQPHPEHRGWGCMHSAVYCRIEAARHGPAFTAPHWRPLLLSSSPWSVCGRGCRGLVGNGGFAAFFFLARVFKFWVLKQARRAGRGAFGARPLTPNPA